jgi:sugar lactone lactonase YvrE
VPPVPRSWLARFRKGSAPTTRTQARASSWLTGVALAILVVALGAQVLTFYFGPYTAQALYQDFTVAGRYIDRLDPRHDLVYQMDTPVMFGDPSPLIFLANQVELRDLGNIADVVPITDNHGRNVHFLVSPAESIMVDTLQRLYPGGTLQTLTRADGSNLVAAYKVPAETLDSNRYVTARYGTSGGAFYERQETRFGTLGGAGDDGEVGVPPNLTYPTTAEWSGGLVVPVYGTYRLRVDAPAGATLHVDGRPIVTAEPGGQPVEVRVVLAKGTHDVRLSGTLDSPKSHVVLLWGVDNGEQVPIGREFLWLAPRGALLGEVYPSYVSPSWITDPEMPAQRPVPSSVRRDGVFSWRNASYAFSGEVNPFARWTGTLIAPVDGDYTFDATTTAQLVLRIDGESVGNVNTGGMDNRWPITIHLTQGEHAIDLRFGALSFNTELQVYWQPPGQERQIMLPQAFAPAPGGVWLADEVAAVPSPDPSVISAVVEEPVTIVSEIAVDPWVGAMGITVLPNGGFAVGDSGAHRLIIYDGSGKQVASWGGAAEGSDTFNDLSDVDSSKDGEIAALDAENALVRFFDGSSKQTRLFKPESLGITHARGAAWSADGHLYVADTGASRVIRIDKNGTIDQVLAEGNGTIPKLDQPVDVALAPDGSVYTVDVGKRIVRFDASGVANGEWRVSMGGLRGGSKLAYWRDRVVITNPDANTVSLLDPRTGGVRLLSLGKDTPLDVSVPTGLAVGTDGNLYVVDSGHNRVLVLALQGQ